MSSNLNDFKGLVDDINDEMLLEVAESLLTDMIAIRDMKEKIEKLEEGLSKGDRAAFWFFAMGLDREQVDLATNAVIGRRRFLKDQEERAKMKKDIKASESEKSDDSLLQI